MIVDVQHRFTPFATGHPGEIRARAAVRGFVDDIRTLGDAGERVLSGNAGLLLTDMRRSP